MPFLPWSEQMVIDGDCIDGQHQQLVATINQLHDLLHGQGPGELGQIIEFLVVYADVHFADEERLMRLSGYPGGDEHHHEHSRFTIQMEAFRESFLAGEDQVDEDLLAFLKAWLINHIMGTDRDIRDCLLAWRKATQINEFDLLEINP